MLSASFAVALLSLSCAQKRRQLLLERGLPKAWVEAYQPARDQRQTRLQSLQTLPLYQRLEASYKRQILPGEYGCLQSHLQAITAFAAKGKDADFLLVLEDDVQPTSLAFQTQLTDLVACLQASRFAAQPLVCHLGPLDRQQKACRARRLYSPKLKSQGLPIFQHLDNQRSLWRAHAYLLNREAAMAYQQVESGWAWLADDWLKIKQALGLRLLFVHPALFVQDEDQASCIANSKDQQTLRLSMTKQKTGCLFQARKYIQQGAVASWRWLPAKRI